MSKTKVIIISGRKHTGKDASADILTSSFGFTRVAFADPLKVQVAKEWDMTIESMHDQTQKEQPLLEYPVIAGGSIDQNLIYDLKVHFRTNEGATPQQLDFNSVTGVVCDESGHELFWTRRALLVLKGKVMRTVDKKYWIRQAVESMKGIGRVVITDCRYPNEADVLKDLAEEKNLDVTVFRLERPGVQRVDEESESAMDNYAFDVVYSNSGTLEDLKAVLSSVANS